MMDLFISSLASSPDEHEVEVAERKGLGHPDTLCDAIAERISVRLCRYYLDHCGVILHHNVDKVLLAAGAARSAFGGGKILAPLELYLAGRATQEWAGQSIPVHEIAVEACRELLRQRLPDLDVDRHVRIFPRLRSGSTDLTQLFARGGAVPRANDTSCGAGFAPLTALERVVLKVERQLTNPDTKRSQPGIGSDVKVIGVRQGRQIRLTISCAVVDRYVGSVEDYLRVKGAAHDMALVAAREVTDLEVVATVNAGDDLAAGEVFLTVSGTSAESGDDGEVGRGNRSNGLITPYRVMTMEAAAGKNPVSHVGKLYGLVANDIAATVAAKVPNLRSATCVLVSQIGRPVDDPLVADVRIAPGEAARREDVQAHVRDIVHDQLGKMPELRQALVDERRTVF